MRGKKGNNVRGTRKFPHLVGKREEKKEGGMIH